MKSTIETLEENKVKVSVQLEDAEFEKELNVAFKALAKEVNLPGFRPGKAPRKVLEARIGQQYARDEAFRTALPTYYSQAVKEHEVDVIAPPEFDITDGQTDGAVAFDAVVEVRPSVEVSGYDSFDIEIPSLEVTEKEIDDAVDNLRSNQSTLETVDRAAVAGDRLSINIETNHGDEVVEGLTTDSYVYELGSGLVVPEIDENLAGVKAGDELSFEAKHPDEDETEPLQIKIEVNEVQEAVLPEATPEWVKENSEFETLEELRADYQEKMLVSRTSAAASARRTKLADAVAELVEDDAVPAAMIESEAENRLQDMAMRLQGQGMDFQQFLQATGQDYNSILGELRVTAASSCKVDLALRSIAACENIEVTDAELDEEYAKVATQVDSTPEKVKQQFVDAGQLMALRSDVLKSKTLDWLMEKVNLVDEEGNKIDPAMLEEESEDNSGEDE